MGDSRPTTEDWAATFADARRADLAAVAGVTLYRSGRRMRGECPICGASKGKKAAGAFSADVEAGVWTCWGCGEHGDVVALEQALRGGSAREAAVRLAGMPRVSAPARPAGLRPSVGRGDGLDGTRPAGAWSAGEKLAREIWSGCSSQRFVDSPGAAYLRARGITSLAVLGAIGDRLRFHPAAKWSWDGDRGDWIRAPAIVGRVVTPSGATGGVHVTYLRADLSAKAALDPAKRMWGPQRDAEGRAGAVWLTSPTAPGPLVVGEGIESTLSAMMLLGVACRGVATLSLGALQGGWLLDRFGRLDPEMVSADPERPAFTWPDQDQVMVAVDRDMKPIKVKVRRLGGGTAERRLEAEDRARICAGLAVQAWQAAGSVRISAIAPAAGRDFNDELVASGSGLPQAGRPSDQQESAGECA
jgi:hypothetical protein